MKRRGRLQRKISSALFVVLLFITVLATVILYFVGTRLIARSVSLAAYPVVRALAEQLSEETRFDLMKTLQLSEKFISLLPGLQLYLLNERGEYVVDLSTNAGGAPLVPVDIKLIQRFVDNPFWDGTPHYVQHPTAEGHFGLFVAARTKIQGETFILLGILDDSIAWATTDAGLDRYLVPYSFIVVGVLLLLSSLSFSSIYFIFTSRLRQLMGLIEEYERGNFSSTVQLSGNDELNELQDSAHSMARQIRHQIEEISERDEVRRDLIAGVSHDLRAPVSTLRFELETLLSLSSVKDNSLVFGKVKKLERVIESLNSMLSQLFELAKLETNEKPADLISYPIGELLHEIVERYTKPAQAAGVTLVVENIDEGVEVRCDPSLVERVLTNLIENAITYTLEGGFVKVSSSPTAKGLQISVADNGVGVAENELDLVFERSFRASKWESRRKTSGGLGLAIVKKLLEAQGSSIRLVSEEGKGSVFAFVLPFALENQRAQFATTSS